MEEEDMCHWPLASTYMHISTQISNTHCTSAHEECEKPKATNALLFICVTLPYETKRPTLKFSLGTSPYFGVICFQGDP